MKWEITEAEAWALAGGEGRLVRAVLDPAACWHPAIVASGSDETGWRYRCRQCGAVLSRRGSDYVRVGGTS